MTTVGNERIIKREQESQELTIFQKSRIKENNEEQSENITRE